MVRLNTYITLFMLCNIKTTKITAVGNPPYAIVSKDKKLARETVQKHIRKTQLLVRSYFANKYK